MWHKYRKTRILTVSDTNMISKIKVEKMIGGTYKAWVEREVKKVEIVKQLLDADGATPEEAKANLEKKLWHEGKTNKWQNK